MTTPTEGGSSPASQINQGKTPNSLQKGASLSISNQQVTDMLLATNYIQTDDLTNGQFDARLADWYRYGKPSSVFTDNKSIFDRQPKTVDPMDQEEPASLRVFGKNRSKGSGDIELVPPFTKLILEGMTEGHAERTQIVETFGTFYVFMFGERPPTYNFSGTLINAKDINWRTDFQFYYDNYLRGTKCVENNARLVMTYGGRQIEGFMINFQTQTDAALEMGVKVSFQVVVTSRLATLNKSLDFGILVKGGKQTSDDSITKLLADIAGKEGKGLSAPATDQANTEATRVMAGGPASGATAAPSGLADFNVA